MREIKEIVVPDIGNYSQVEIIEMSIALGDSVRIDDTLLTLETEKAAMDVPSPFTGKITEIKVKAGDKVSKGDVLALIEIEDKAVAPGEQLASGASVSAPSTSEKTPEVASIVQQEVRVPDIGNYRNVEIIELNLKEGDSVNKEDTLLTLETEKAAMDVPSPVTGVIKSLKVQKGDKVSQDDLIALIEMKAPQGAPSEKRESQPQKAAVAPNAPASTQSAPATYTSNTQVHAGPAVRRLAREFGIDLTKVNGTGPKNRIITPDLHQYVKSVLQNNNASGIAIEKAPEIDFSQFGEIETTPLSRIKKWTAKNLHRNWVTIPHVTQFDEADISELEAFRQENKQAAEEAGVKLTPLPFIIKAVISALKAFPQFNASLAANQTDLILKKYVHIGIAMDTPNGLVVPVIRNADSKGIFELARELSEYGMLAREGKLTADKMTGSCFSLSSLGNLGGTGFTPIINAPDVAILGISKMQIKPIVQQEKIIIGKMLPLSLSYDHRVIDGVEGAKFLGHIIAQLHNIRQLLL